MTSQAPFIIKRDGRKEPIYFDKITRRNQALVQDLNLDVTELSRKVIGGIKSGMKTEELDVLSSETAIYMSIENEAFEVLAKRIFVDNLHKKTSSDFIQTTKFFASLKNGQYLHADYLKFVLKHEKQWATMLDYTRDYDFNYFGLKTLEKGYLWKTPDGKIVERPQHMWLRVSIFIHMSDCEEEEECISKIKQSYDSMSRLLFTHASPTLFHAGSFYPQLASCFLLTMEKDSLDGIFTTLSKCATISKFGGGIGLSASHIRARGSLIQRTNGRSDGLIPCLKIFNETMRYVNQGSMRKGSATIYLEPWHPDVLDFIKMRSVTTHENARCLDLNIALWIPDLFMKRVEQNLEWSFICPSDCPQLVDLYGEEFNQAYKQAELTSTRKTIRAQELFRLILVSQIETGEPFIHFKDAINRKTNHSNLGVIRGSNLCCEIMQYTEPGSIANCNLASISLPKFVKDGTFQFEWFGQTIEIMTENLNKVIDKNYYPLSDTRINNKKYRPLGIGVQGLADLFLILDYSWDSKEALELNRDIFECMYYFAIKKSCELSRKYGPYDGFKTCPMSRGIFQFDYWKHVPSGLNGLCDWKQLKQNVMKHGVYNSLFTTVMPTASTSQILGNNECTEPYTTNLYTRQVLSGDYPIMNKHLITKLKEIGLDDPDTYQHLIRHYGSIQKHPLVSNELKRLFRTVWEIPQKVILDMAITRGPFIDQSQSMNVFFETPTVPKLSSMLFYGWKHGLKTGMYYLRRSSLVQSVPFTVEKDPLECTSCSG